MTTALTPNARQYQQDAFGPDLSDLPPAGAETALAAMTHEMIADAAPRLFAVVEEDGERVDAAITAWGMAFPDHVEVVSADSMQRMSVQAPESALRMVSSDSPSRARLVWLTLAVAAPATNDDEAA